MLRSINSLEICLSDFSQSIVTHNSDSQSERQYFEMGLAEQNNANNLSIYHAPEVITNQAYSFKSDLFSIGVILFKLLIGKKPFDHVLNYLGESKQSFDLDLVL